MWFSSFLLFLAFTSVIADIEADLELCTDLIDADELEEVANMKSDEMEVLCPMFQNFFSCIENVVESETGLSLEQLAGFLTGTEYGPMADIIVNVRNVIDELCTEGTPLNTDYKADAECFDRMDDPSNVCEEKAVAAYRVYRGVIENAEEAADDDDDPDKDCLKLAYQSACMAAVIHDTCGRRAFNTYNTVVKRTSVFKNALCSKKGLEELKTTFLDSLEKEDAERELFRLAFDLRKRRK